MRLRDRLEMLVPPLPWDRPRQRGVGAPSVVLLHGLWRGFRAMEPLARELYGRGFAVINVPYPSSRLPVSELSRRVANVVAGRVQGGTVHFVTHSLGGILLRAMLADGAPWTTGRVVMLAPPNQGSEIVDWMAGKPLLPWLLGPAGRDLGTTGAPAVLPSLPTEVEAAVVMGRKSTIPVFRKLLGEDNDGIVSAGRGTLPGMRHYAVVDADHTFIQLHPEVVRMTAGFLKSGEW